MTRSGSTVRTSRFAKDGHWRSGRHALLGAVLLLAAGLAGVVNSTGASGASGCPPACPTSVTLTPFTTAAKPIGIDYDEPTNQLIVSDHYSNGSPNNLDLVASNGTFTPFGGSTAKNMAGEIYLSAIRSSPMCNGALNGGFTVGDVYVGTGVSGQIGRISNNGTTFTKPWVTLPNTGVVTGLFQDRYCDLGGKDSNNRPFQGDLVVTTYNVTYDPPSAVGDVWLVTPAGTATKVGTNVGDFLEGPTTLPRSDFFRYPLWAGPTLGAGKILVTDEVCGCLKSVDPAGPIGSNVSTYSGFGASGEGAEGVQIVPPNENFYGVDYGGNAILAAPASQFTAIVGDVVVATEVPGQLLDVKWTNAGPTSYDMLSPNDSMQFEGTTFAPAGLGPVLPTVGTLKICKVAGFGVKVGFGFGFSVKSTSTGTQSVTVPAGPPPGGYCEVAGSNYALGSSVTIQENSPYGTCCVTAITVPGQVVSSDLSTGTVNVTIGSGVTEATYTDTIKAATAANATHPETNAPLSIGPDGVIEICKQFPSGSPPASTLFTFTVPTVNGNQTIKVPAGACSPPIAVIPGNVVVTESPVSQFALASCSTLPAGDVVSCNPSGNNTATITVANGGLSAETILTVTNSFCGPPKCGIPTGAVCKTASGQATFSPALPIFGSKTTVKPTLTATEALAGCNGGGVTSGRVSLTAIPESLSGGGPLNCTSLFASAMNVMGGTETVTWNTKKTSTVNIGIEGNPKVPHGLMLTITGNVTAGLFKGDRTAATLTLTPVPPGGCTRTPMGGTTVTSTRSNTF